MLSCMFSTYRSSGKQVGKWTTLAQASIFCEDHFMYQMSLPFMMAGNQAPVMLHAENSEPSFPTPDMHTFFQLLCRLPSTFQFGEGWRKNRLKTVGWWFIILLNHQASPFPCLPLSLQRLVHLASTSSSCPTLLNLGLLSFIALLVLGSNSSWAF